MQELMPRVDIITVNYNGSGSLKGYFEGLKMLDYPKSKLRLFFVDNGSKDGSLRITREFDPGFEVVIIENGCNCGFAKAVNIAIRRSDAPSVALLNTDTKVAKDWLSMLVVKMGSDEKVGIAGSRQIPQESSRKIDPITNETSWCSGGHCLIRRSALDSVGLLDEAFFMYGEDVDLSWRMWLAGYKCVYVPLAVCNHHYDGKGRFIVRRLHYHVRNSILLRYCYGNSEESRRQLSRWIKEGAACAVKRLQWGRAWAVLSGVIAHFFYRGHFLQKGRGLKVNPLFAEIKDKWITL